MNKRMLTHSLLALTSLCLITAPSFAEPQNLDKLKAEIREYHDTGVYNREIMQVAERAKQYIHATAEANKKASKPAKLALVFDIDETTVSNYKGMVERKFCDDPKLINRAIHKANAPAIEPMLALYKDAKKHDVAVFFVTGRRPSFQRSTERNLKRAGYTTWRGLYFRPDQDTNPSVIPYKTQARASITRHGYKIIASIGDQASDLTGGYAEKTFKLPNPYYHLP